MIKRLDSLKMFGKPDSQLSERSETYFGALVYMLACGRVSKDPCWAQNYGTEEAVKDTLSFLYYKFSDIPSGLILSEFNSVCRMVCYNVKITDHTTFRRCTQRTDCCMEDVRRLYDSNATFKSFITRVKNVDSPHGYFSEYATASLSEIRDIAIYGNCGIDNFVDIVIDFLNERDTNVAVHDRVSALIKSSFVSVGV